MRYLLNGAIGEIDSLPGCSQVAVSHSVFVRKELQNKGCGTRANKTRLTVMKHELGYDYALCTVESTNEKQKAILVTNGWRQLSCFTSSKTNHIVQIWGRDLKDII